MNGAWILFECERGEEVGDRAVRDRVHVAPGGLGCPLRGRWKFVVAWESIRARGAGRR